MDNGLAPAGPERSRMRACLRPALFVLGCFAIVLTTTDFIAAWLRTPENFGTSLVGRTGLLAALAFGATRLLARGSLVPLARPARLLYRLQGHAVLWTSFLATSTGGEIGGRLILVYLVGLGISRLANRATAWEDYAASPRPTSGWLVRCLAALAVSLWVMSRR